jgi:small subunit ribosomal protein S16
LNGVTVATRIRLARYGAKKTPYYRLVVADGRTSRDGRFIEIIGHYDPKKGIEQAELKEDRLRHWLACGAQPSDTARQIIRKKFPQQ